MPPPALGRGLSGGTDSGPYRVLFANPWDIPAYVARGTVDLGITGRDIVAEQGEPVEERFALRFGRCELALAAPAGSPVERSEQIPRGARIATSYPNLVRAFFARAGRRVEIVPTRGAVEVTPLIGAADFVADLVETGHTLRANNLTPLGSIFGSQAVLIAPRRSGRLRADPERAPVRELETALRSIVEAEGRRCLFAQVPRRRVARIASWFGTAASFTDLVGATDRVALRAAVPEEELNPILRRLRDDGATDIMVLPLQRVMP